jgi:purine-binding chemotaxis protein CheW
MATENTIDVGTGNHEEHVVIFRLAQEFYALDIQHIQEIVRMQQVTSIPGAAYFVDGLMTFRGSAIPVLDLRRRCGVTADEHTPETRIVVVTAGSGMVGLTVDAVTEVRHIPGENVEANSDVVRASENEYIRGIAKLDDRLVALIELSELIPTSEAPQTAAAASLAAAA